MAEQVERNASVCICGRGHAATQGGGRQSKIHVVCVADRNHKGFPSAP